MGKKYHRRPAPQNESETRLMLPKIIAALKKKKISGWQIRETHKKSFQSFLALTKKECQRLVATTSYQVTVFQKNGDKLGLSSFKLGPQQADQIEPKIEAALFAASLVQN